MNKKKSNKKVSKSAATLDDSMIEQEVVSSPTASRTGKVSLKDYYKNAPFSFNSKNYKLLLIGLGVNILGFILMIGGATKDPNVFDAESMFSHTRITIAPMLIVAGYVVIMYSIMKKPKS